MLSDVKLHYHTIPIGVERAVTGPLRGVPGVRVGVSVALGVLGLLHSKLVI